MNNNQNYNQNYNQNQEYSEEKEKKSKVGIIIIIIILLLLLVSSTVAISYHFFSKMNMNNSGSTDNGSGSGSDNGNISSSGNVTVFYLTGQDILVEDMNPIYEEDAPRHTFMLENNGESSQKYNISFANIQLKRGDKKVKSANLKWKLYSSDEHYEEIKELATGNFSSTDSSLPILEDITIQPKAKQYYILKIWLEETEEVQNEDQGLTFSAQVKISLFK